jgi:hypothetical protein
MTQSFYVITLCSGSVIKKEEAFSLGQEAQAMYHEHYTYSWLNLLCGDRTASFALLHGDEPWTYRHGTIGTWRLMGGRMDWRNLSLSGHALLPLQFYLCIHSHFSLQWICAKAPTRCVSNMRSLWIWWQNWWLRQLVSLSHIHLIASEMRRLWGRLSGEVRAPRLRRGQYWTSKGP